MNKDTKICGAPIRTAYDTFSWRRVMMFARTYRYTIRRQLLIYGALSLLAAAATLIPIDKDSVHVGIWSMFISMLAMAYGLAPAAFAKSGNNRAIEQTVPASAAEKLTFYMLYNFVVVGTALYILPCAAELIYLNTPSLHTPRMLEMIRIVWGHPANALMKVTQNMMMSVTAFYVVMNTRTNRTLKSILAGLGTWFALGVIGAIYGLMETIDVFEKKLAGLDPANSEHIARQLVSDMFSKSGLFYSIAAVCAIYTVVMVCLCYRRMRRPRI